MSPPVPRRLLLAAPFAGMLAGCTPARQTNPVPPVPSPDPDAVAIRAALAVTERLRASYGATMARHARARAPLELLGLLAAEHDAHADALQAALAAGTLPGPTATSPAPSTSPPPQVPAEAPDAVAALAVREDAAARAHDAALGALSAEAARLLAAVCGARAAHAALLRVSRK